MCTDHAEKSNAWILSFVVDVCSIALCGMHHLYNFYKISLFWVNRLVPICTKRLDDCNLLFSHKICRLCKCGLELHQESLENLHYAVDNCSKVR